MPAEKSLTLNINGKKYSGWTKAKITRGIDRAVGDFEFEVSERWLNKSNGQLQIQPQDTCTIYAGSDLLLTGYVDKYKPSVDANNHKVVISGRSKTGDLVDSSVDFLGGQIQSGTLLAMATALCAPFHIKVRTSLGKNGSKVNSTPGDATVQPGETVFNFLERLARQVGVLLTDDPAGNLVLIRITISHHKNMGLLYFNGSTQTVMLRKPA
jgi:prophage tail gpP-like protein